MIFLFRSGASSTSSFECLKDRKEYRQFLCCRDGLGWEWVGVTIVNWVGLLGVMALSRKLCHLGGGKGNYIFLFVTTVICWIYKSHPFHFWHPFTGPLIPSTLLPALNSSLVSNHQFLRAVHSFGELMANL